MGMWFGNHTSIHHGGRNGEDQWSSWAGWEKGKSAGPMGCERGQTSHEQVCGAPTQARGLGEDKPQQQNRDKQLETV